MAKFYFLPFYFFEFRSLGSQTHVSQTRWPTSTLPCISPCCHALNWLVLQKKALRIINFQPRNSSPLFKKSSFRKFWDKFNLENTLFVSKSINNLLPSLFNNWFLFSSDQHNYETSWSSLDNLHKPSYKTNTYGKNSIVVSAINAWNNSQNFLKISLRHLSPIKI